MNFKKMLLIGSISLGMCLSFSEVASAEEELFFQKPDSNNTPLVILGERSDLLIISEENKTLIDKAIDLDSENKTYIDSIIDSYIIEQDATLESYNIMINNAVTSIISNNEENNKNLEALNQELKESEVVSPKNSESRAVDPITLARLAYDAGVLIVKNKPAPVTASYMNHAKVAFPFSPQPSKVVHNNDAWAKKVATDNGFNGMLNGRFFNEVYGNQSKTLTGVYEFDYGDPAYALAHATYSVTFVRQSNGGYKATYKITDYYDFDWSNYDNILVGFGNNYCLAMQTLKLIKPFDISITYTM